MEKQFFSLVYFNPPQIRRSTLRYTYTRLYVYIICTRAHACVCVCLKFIASFFIFFYLFYFIPVLSRDVTIALVRVKNVCKHDYYTRAYTTLTVSLGVIN